MGLNMNQELFKGSLGPTIKIQHRCAYCRGTGWIGFKDIEYACHKCNWDFKNNRPIREKENEYNN